MNYYIIFTQEIHSVGGMQLYTAGKTEYMDRIGWKTIVFHPDDSLKKCAYHYLDNYKSFAYPIIEIPPNAYSEKYVNHIIRKMVRKLSLHDVEKVYIESQYDIAALWAELLAERINGIHINFNCNEIFRGGYKIYEYILDFFWFKYKRHELLGLRPDVVCKIFEGYMDIEPDVSTLFDAVEPNPIQDVKDKRVGLIQEADFTVLYLGRAVKGYVPNILEGVANFASAHKNKRIQLCIIGDARERRKLISSVFDKCVNVKVIMLGDMVPIPKEVYDHIDVVIAGAVCAEISARMGVPTIVADCENYLANGVLGYTVHNSMYHEKEAGQTLFDEALENVLVHKEYLTHKFSFPNAISSDDIYLSHLHFFNECEKEDYYKVIDIKLPINYKKISYWLRFRQTIRDICYINNI